MVNFLLGIVASIVAGVVGWVTTKILWPYFEDKVLYKGVRVDGAWEIHEVRNGTRGIIAVELRSSSLECGRAGWPLTKSFVVLMRYLVGLEKKRAEKLP